MWNDPVAGFRKGDILKLHEFSRKETPFNMDQWGNYFVDSRLTKTQMPKE
jgi:hypothetical protein